jgi:UDP-N-acetylglucosamine 2-epimerase (non-hydrolysing)
MAPVILEFKRFPREFSITVVNTAQHGELVTQALSIFNLVPDISFNIMKRNQNLFDVTGAILINMKKLFTTYSPDIVLVQGDTTTAFASALSAYFKKIPIGHIEAGLRTYNKYSPYPEEINRRSISLMATFHFAPTKHAKRNLLSEHIEYKSIYVTGNTVIDAAQFISPQDSKTAQKEKLILVTTHRRESFDSGLTNILYAVKNIAKQYPDFRIVLPVHPNPIVKNAVKKILVDIPNISLENPLDYRSFILLLKCSYLIITDSGGIQEEAAVFHTPLIIVRNVTERPEAIIAGYAKLAGTETKNIIAEVKRVITNKQLYETMTHSKNPFGNGKASQKIVSILRKKL